jgi:hypothetical protein
MNMKSAIFWDVLPCSLVVRWTYCFHLQDRWISRSGNKLAASRKQCSTVKMEAVLSSGTSVNFYQITLYHIPEDGTLQGTYTLHRDEPMPSINRRTCACANVYIRVYCGDCVRCRSFKSICNAGSIIIIIIIIISITVHNVAGIAYLV